MVVGQLALALSVIGIASALRLTVTLLVQAVASRGIGLVVQVVPWCC